MSWDISICKFVDEYDAIEDIPDDAIPVPLGSAVEVRAAISKAFPATDWSDPNWGVFEAPFGSIEFNINSDDPVEGLMMHVRATQEIVPPIVDLCRSQGWQAMDMNGECFLEKTEVPEAGLQKWRSYLHQILDAGKL